VGGWWGSVSEGLCYVCLEQLLWFLCAFLPTVNTIVFASNHYRDNVNARQFTSTLRLSCVSSHSLQHSCANFPLTTA